MPLTTRSQLRAALIAFAIVVSLVEGCPVPHAGHATLAHPANQREVERWSEILTELGYAISPPDLAERVVAASDALGRMHGRIVAPVAPLQRWTRTSQRWNLFPLADPAPYRMHVEAQCSGEWRLLYRPLDPDHRFMGTALEYRRLRGAWNPGVRGPRPAYGHFVDFLTARIFDAYPDCDRARVRFEQIRLPRPGEERRATPSEWVFEQQREREGS